VFFFNVTHELRTPLNSIIGFNTLAVETGELGLLASGFIKNSLTSAETLLRLIDQILDVGAQARESSGNSVSGNSASVDSVSGNSVSGNSASGNSTSGDATAGDEPFTLSQLVEFVTHATRFPKEKRTVAESVTRNAEGPENENFGADRHPDVVVTLTNPQYFTKTLTGDFQNLRSCLVTLVDNAVKFSTDLPGRDGLVELVIEVTEKETHEEEGRVRRTLSHSDECGDFELEPLRSVSITFRVKDNGIGIPLEKQHALFVPFCQPADRRAPGTGQKEKGTGLGLVLTRQKVARMGGALDFKSVPDRGTKFFFACEFAVRSETESVSVPRMRATTLKLARGGSVDTVFTLPGDSSGSSSGDKGEGSGQKFQPGLRGSASKKGGEAGRIDEKIPPPVAIARPTASIPKDTRIILHTSFVGHNKRHVTNILICYGLSPGTNYVSLRRENDLLGKMRQVKKLGGSPIVFMEAIGDDVNEHCAVLDFVCAADSQKRTTRVSFEEHDVDAAKAKDTATATEPSTKFVVIFGRPKRVMRMRNVLGDRNDVAFVFTPATPCEIANVVSRVHAVLANARRRGPKTFSQKKTRGPSSMDLARHGFPRAADVSGASLNLPASAFAKTTFETAFAEATKKSARASSSGAA
jgi:signal transduction histidine kinase